MAIYRQIKTLINQVFVLFLLQKLSVTYMQIYYLHKKLMEVYICILGEMIIIKLSNN